MEIIVNPEPRTWEQITARPRMQASTIGSRVEGILERVRNEGDYALQELTREIDGVSLPSLVVTRNEIEEASEKLTVQLKEAIQIAAKNIRTFHQAQNHAEVEVETFPGVRCIQRSIPIQRVGLYIPGGSAPLFSTVLMLAIPAQIAGCKELILCTPPNKRGEIAPEILYTTSLCGVDRIFKVGGAQAIGAMAYGTASIPKTDKIFGPGNQYVTVAKQIVSSEVAIDMPAGPSEVMVLADSTANPSFVAADLLSQAEHGADSQALLLTTSRSMAEQVMHAVNEQLERLSRSSVAVQALDHSRLVVLDDPQEMIALANLYGAEHLIISMENPWEVAAQITAAGSIFLGNYTPESAGDYASGTNHTLPTYGWARSHSGVNLDSFMRKVTLQEITPAGLQGLGGVIETMAEAEGLDGHKNAVTLRLNALKEL